MQRAGAITGALCMAHARRELFEAHKLNGSEIAAHAVALIARPYEVERDTRELQPAQRLPLRQSRAKPVADALHAWLLEKRQTSAKADITAKAIDYSLSNWRALMHYLVDDDVPIDNNAAENAIRPLAVGRKNWLFIGSQQAGERAAVMLSLIESAKLNGYDLWAYLKDVFKRLPTLKNRDLDSMLPHNWKPADKAAAQGVPVAPTAVMANAEPSKRRRITPSPSQDGLTKRLPSECLSLTLLVLLHLTCFTNVSASAISAPLALICWYLVLLVSACTDTDTNKYQRWDDPA
jgi:hypothetical protein